MRYSPEHREVIIRKFLLPDGHPIAKVAPDKGILSATLSTGFQPSCPYQELTAHD
jgi:hypothetical protein